MSFTPTSQSLIATVTVNSMCETIYKSQLVFLLSSNTICGHFSSIFIYIITYYMYSIHIF